PDRLSARPKQPRLQSTSPYWSSITSIVSRLRPDLLLRSCILRRLNALIEALVPLAPERAQSLRCYRRAWKGLPVSTSFGYDDQKHHPQEFEATHPKAFEVVPADNIKSE